MEDYPTLKSVEMQRRRDYLSMAEGKIASCEKTIAEAEAAIKRYDAEIARHKTFLNSSL